MGRLKIAGILLIIMISILIWHSIAINNKYTELLSQVNQVKNAVERFDWYYADIEFEKLDNMFKNVKNWFSIVMNHQDISHLNNAFYQTKYFLQKRDADKYLAQNNILELYLEHIPERDKFSVENIF